LVLVAAIVLGRKVGWLKSECATEKELEKRTLTTPYNQRPPGST
jgi:hypothetical protein